MADIELVIKIPEEEYESIKKHPNWHSLGELIAHGTPLPKGHGRLVDADKLLETWYDDFCEFMTQAELDSMNNIIKNAPAIIEADKEEE